MISTAEQWYGSLGAGWRALRFKHVATIVGGQVDPTDDRYSTLPLFAPNHMESGTGRLLAVDSAEDQAAESGKYLVADGDVLYSKIRPALRKVVVAPTAGLCSADVYAIRPNRRLLEPRFLFYLLLSEGFAQYSLLESDRVAMPKINREALGECPLVFPALDRQRAIVGFLDAKTANIDALIAKQEQLLALLAEKRQALITQAVTKGLDPNVAMKDTGVAWFGQVPKHWEVSRIGYMAVVGNGSTPSREEARFWSEDENGYPWLNSARINDERIVRAERWVTCDALRECHLPKVPPGSVVVAITGEGQTRARAALLEIEATISQHLAYVRPRHGLNAVFLWRQLQAAYQWLRDQSAGGGSTRAALTCEFLRTVSIVVPPLAEQELIVSHIDSELRRIDSLSQRVQAMIERLCEYRQALITAAVTGQLDVTSGAVATSAPKPYAEAVGT